MIDDVRYEVNAGFFHAINEDRVYSAEDMNRPYRRLISNGVFATPKEEPSDDLQVLAANNGMNVIVSTGDAFIGNKWFENPKKLMITISKNSDVLSRVDSIIAQVDKTLSGRKGSIVYRKGNASSNPTHPNINTEENIYEIRLADILISPSCVKITQDLITDCRGSSECPWITSLIKQVDTSTLYAQWQEAYRKYYAEQTAECAEFVADFKESMSTSLAEEKEIFKIWFNSLKEILDENTAGHLLNLIDETDTYIPRKANITLLKDNWVKNGKKYEYTIINNIVTEDHYIQINMLIDEQQKMFNGEVESFTGKYVIRTTDIPDGDVEATVVIQKTFKENEHTEDNEFLITTTLYDDTKEFHMETPKDNLMETVTNITEDITNDKDLIIEEV